MDFSPIAILILLLVSAFIGVMVLNILRWPTVPAYFIAGMVMGPSGMRILHDDEKAQFIAELGIIFLLFTIGLKFSLEALRTIRRHVFWLGGAQTFLTMLLFAMPIWWWSGDFVLSILIGSVAAMSSTAIVSQLLVSENILSSPVGNRAMGVLLFQDLAVIPLIVIFSSTDAGEVSSVLHLAGLVALKVVLVMVFVLLVGAPIMSRWLDLVARYGDKELYMLNMVMIIGLMAGLTAWAGLSYALGAFVAGILMSETLHRYRVLRIVEPFRQLFLGFFFVSLGVLVDPVYLLHNILPVLGVALLLIAVKGPLVYACVKLLGAHAKTALFVTLLLCGTGEFGFVLLTLAHGNQLVEDSLFQLLLTANMAALVVIPFFWRYRERLAGILPLSDWLTEAKKITDNLSQTSGFSGHVIIAGFGRTGQSIAGILRDISLPYVALEDNYQILRAVGGADHVIFAEGSGAEGLLSAGIMRARVLIISYVDPVDSKTTAQIARGLNRNLLIVAKADSTLLADELIAAGADRAMVDAYEFGFSAAKVSAMAAYGLSSGVLRKSIYRARKKENPFFTGEFSSGLDDSSDNQTHVHPFIGCVVRNEIATLESAMDGCRVISWLRGGQPMDLAQIRQPLQIGDELVLAGKLDDLWAAKKRIEDLPAE